MTETFTLKAGFKPEGDQPKAIKQLIDGFKSGKTKQTLLGVTGSGKTFTISNAIQKLNKPTLVIAHNKTLAAQLYQEFKEFFPENKVEYFVSYYDYYQPESYLPASDTYIEKELSINPKIEQMRLSATHSLMTRKDVIIVASVSCIYGLGNPKNYYKLSFNLKTGMKLSRRDFLGKLLDMQYERNDMEFTWGTFRVRGNSVDVHLGHVLRVEFDGDTVKKLSLVDPFNFFEKTVLNDFFLFPAKHFVVDKQDKEDAIKTIRKELERELPKIDDLLIKHRLKKRVEYDLEMIKELGYCNGIENYSRHFDKRKPGKAPYCLLDYFPKDFLVVIDESHQTIPQVRGMFNGDVARKESLVRYGFRLPSAFDNRPLKFNEFETYLKNAIFVSATPADYEKKHSSNIVEQIIRPTGLVDPRIETQPITGQMNTLLSEITATTKKGNRTLVTTLTKHLAEELTEFLSTKGVRVRYLHSEIDTLERSEIIRQLRAGDFDVLVGINLLREGLDIPEVALVAILDADKQGFLRNDTSLIQTIGRAARNAESKVILFCDKITDSIRFAIAETERRRNIQTAYNKKHGITPKTIKKEVGKEITTVKDTKHVPKKEIPAIISQLEIDMQEAADQLNFELAIQLRNQITRLKQRLSTEE
ncbi:excinuclease ABC subunit B [archaeon CG10_big_fil_rev_8_21_14_0_10_43_11]|nr:MAG: excinuclease ABC subunit B [archaeon CG10_big_fil_rev_8_21_14_0_10_43_11]